MVGYQYQKELDELVDTAVRTNKGFDSALIDAIHEIISRYRDSIQHKEKLANTIIYGLLTLFFNPDIPYIPEIKYPEVRVLRLNLEYLAETYVKKLDSLSPEEKNRFLQGVVRQCMQRYVQ